MAAEFLFDSRGQCIAFRIGKHVFDADANWVGWLPSDGRDVVAPLDGAYIGTIVGDRFYDLKKPRLPFAGYPAPPPHPGYPGFSGRVRPESIPAGAADVAILQRGQGPPAPLPS